MVGFEKLIKILVAFNFLNTYHNLSKRFIKRLSKSSVICLCLDTCCFFYFLEGSDRYFCSVCLPFFHEITFDFLTSHFWPSFQRDMKRLDAFS